MTRLLLLAALAGTSLTPALAADMMETMPIASFNWTGAYIGAQAGYAWGDSTYDTDPNTSFANIDPDGGFVGAHVGYNMQMNSGIVLGIEGDINYSNVEGTGQFDFGTGVAIPDTFASSELNWSGSVNGRVGYAMDRFLPYFTGGLAVGDYEHTLIIPGSTTDFSETYVGYNVGVGVEYAFTDHLTTRVEYRFTDYGDESFDTSGLAFPHSVDLSTNEVRVGLSYRF